MNKEKIAIIIDSGVDVPVDMIEKYGIIQVPLRINFSDKSYDDKVDLSTDDLFEMFDKEIPQTSLPKMDAIQSAFSRVKSEGYTHVIAVTISSVLSGTYNAFRLVAEEFADESFEVFVFDTLSLSVTCGAFAINSARLIEKGASFAEIVNFLNEHIYDSKIFISFSTLNFLRKGGRIGKIAGFMGELLDLKPIASCGDDGILAPIAKARGWKKAVTTMLNCAKDFAEKGGDFSVYLVYTKMNDEIKSIVDRSKQTFQNAQEFIEMQVSATLAVHTGPVAFGVGIFRY